MIAVYIRRMAVRRRLFAIGYDPLLWRAERRGMASLRSAHLGRAHGRVIEIGAGTGLNVPHYDGDRVDELTLVEPEVLLHSRLKQRLAASPLQGRVVAAVAEALPFDEDSFDVAVVTLVLCTVPDPDAALAEIARVLRPGGELLFIEHVTAGAGSRLAAWQDRLHRPWRAVACGCNTNRDTRRLIDDSPLTITEISNERWRSVPAIVQPLIVGSAAAG
ncbi:MAG TPA: class I SAM-dependent methyltransferase [Gaiellaceae bacterium]